MTCSGDNGDCPEPVEAAGLCRGHRWRKQHGKPIDTPLNDYGDAWGTVSNAMERYCETDGFDREAFNRAKANVQMAMRRWMSKRYHLVPKRKRSRSNNLPKPTDS